MSTPTTQKARLGVGLYSVAEASRLLRAPTARVRRWIDPDAGLVARAFDPDEDTISFLELMELFFIKMFRDEGVSLQTIKKASGSAARKFNARYPFAVERFDTDGKTIFATLIDESQDRAHLEDLAKGQYVFEKIMRPFFRKLEYRQQAVRYWPLELRGRVVLDPERRFGKPIDAPTGVPTKAIYEALLAAGGQDRKAVARWLGTPLQAVDAAVNFERSLVV